MCMCMCRWALHDKASIKLNGQAFNSCQSPSIQAADFSDSLDVSQRGSGAHNSTKSSFCAIHRRWSAGGYTY